MIETRSGYYSPVQTVPLWALSSIIPASAAPKMWAVRLTVPAGQSLSTVVMPFIPDSYFNGTAEVVLYETKSAGTYPIVRGENGLSPSHLAKVGLQYPVAARDESWRVWVAIRFIDLVGVSIPVAESGVYHSQTVADCYSSISDELPLELFSTGIWTNESRYPLIAVH
ncbi:hypothetical protein [Nonomuraea sp. NPDC049141]|uniref:hypothetical protein n=1 Tax=Nonomuraea sp. NPDC049141 TaxID=3155500 RepID=UPI0033FFEC74